MFHSPLEVMTRQGLSRTRTPNLVVTREWVSVLGRRAQYIRSLSNLLFMICEGLEEALTELVLLQFCIMWYYSTILLYRLTIHNIL